MASIAAINDAKRHYKSNSPTHGSSTQSKADLEVISKSSQPMTKAETLIERRRMEQIAHKVDDMLADLQGRKTGFGYNQSAAQQLEHLSQSPLDPITQMPIWLDLLRLTKGTTVSRSTFMQYAQRILCQHSLYDARSMAC